jgi:hypothetical protein
MIHVILDEFDPDEPMQPTLSIDGDDMYEAIVGNAPQLHRQIIADIISKNQDVPQQIREAYIHQRILGIPMHWVQSLVTGVAPEFLPDYAGEDA